MSLTTPLDKYISDHSSPEGDYLYRLSVRRMLRYLLRKWLPGMCKGVC